MPTPKAPAKTPTLLKIDTEHAERGDKANGENNIVE